MGAGMSCRVRLRIPLTGSGRGGIEHRLTGHAGRGHGPNAPAAIQIRRAGMRRMRGGAGRPSSLSRALCRAADFPGASASGVFRRGAASW